MATEKRLIDVNKVIDEMQKCIDESPYERDSIASYTFGAIIECLKQEPTVDAVEVVWKPVLGFEGLYEISNLGEVIAMSKNDYLKKREARDQAWLDVGEEMGVQKMADYIAIALHDPDVMGKNVYSRERIEKFMQHLSRIADEYAKAFTLDKEADYVQEQLDRAQKEIYGDDMQPFKMRYPYVKEISYKKAKKGWVD